MKHFKIFGWRGTALGSVCNFNGFPAFGSTAEVYRGERQPCRGDANDGISEQIQQQRALCRVAGASEGGGALEINEEIKLR